MNIGKRFENNWKSSIPTDVLYYRLQDPPQSFNKGSSGLRFSWKNPCDCFLWSGKYRTFYTLELKTSGTKSFSFEREKGSNKTANIHYHQIEALTQFSQFEGDVSGFVFNFRLDDCECTYFQNIIDFNRMISNINKKSFNLSDLQNYNPVPIEQTKKKVNYGYNIESFLEKTSIPL